MKGILFYVMKSRWFPRALARILVSVFPGSIPWFYGKQVKGLYKKYDGDLAVNIFSDDLSRKMARRVYEKDTLSVLNRYLKPGDVFVDVGANVGAVSLVGSKRVGVEGRVLAIEPGNRNFQNLLANLELNKQYTKNVTAIKFAVSDKTGVNYWVEDSLNLGNAFVYESLRAFDASSENFHIIDSVTLDSLFIDLLKLQKISFVKIDVEGMEWEVLHGMLRCLQQFRPIVYFETVGVISRESHKGRPIYREIEELFRRQGYKLFDPESSAMNEVFYPHFSKNTLAIPEGIS